MLTISEDGLNFIKAFEDFCAKPYLCPADVLTIGYGHAILPGEKFTEITEKEAVELLKKDCAKFIDTINKLVKVALNRNQFDALVSFVFNIGVGAFTKSTLLELLNQGDYVGAANQMPRWNKINGKPSNGLTTSRQLEKCLFLTPVQNRLHVPEDVNENE
jgi:lysozyme